MFRTLFAVTGILCAVTSHAGEDPQFALERLTVPRVDSVGQVAKFQDGVLTRLPSGLFRLDGVDTLDVGKVYQLPGIQAIELRAVGAVPTAVFLRISGVDPTCDHVSPLRYAQRRDGTRLDVVVSSRHLYERSAQIGCVSNFRPYRLTVPLDVYGLAGGTYTVTVNGVHSGQFVLAAENRYADDCHETLLRQCPQ